jgi:hypothetical protein
LESQKQAEYSKALKLDEREEILMDKESDVELEEINKLMEPHVQSCLSSEDKYQRNHIYISARTGVVPNVSDFAGPPKGNKSANQSIKNQSDVSNIRANLLLQDDFFRLH